MIMRASTVLVGNKNYICVLYMAGSHDIFKGVAAAREGAI